MKTKLVWMRLFVLALATVATASGLTPTGDTQSNQNRPPVLATTCLITNDVKRLTAFYQHVLDTKPNVASENYVEFRTGAGILAIFAAQAQERYIPGSAKAGTKQQRDPGVQGGRRRRAVRGITRLCQNMG